MNKESKGLDINVKTFITSILVIFVLMLASYCLTFIIPSGIYARVLNESGNLVIDLEKGYTPTQGGLSFIKFLLSPILVLTTSNGSLIFVIVIFLLIIGGAFNTLEKCNLMKYMLNKIAGKYYHSRFKLLSFVSLFFMTMGAFVGSFEEVVPLVPICVALTNSLGFDVYTGLFISLLSVGCGFSTGVCNAFTVGIAQQMVGLPIFSGISLRLLSFVCIYSILTLLIQLHARKVVKPIDESDFEYVQDSKMEKAYKTFAITMFLGIVIVLSSPILTFLQDYTLVIVALTFLIASISSPLLCGMKYKELGINMLDGAKMMLPAAIMILMASSIRYILEESYVLDTLLYYLINISSSLDKWVLVIFIYLIVQIMDFFVSSGSAKAFMLIPLIVPVAQVYGISSQLCILAYAFGDGFSNVFFPTNPALLISLSMANISYGKWVKHTWLFMLINQLLTTAILLLGFIIKY